MTFNQVNSRIIYILFTSAVLRVFFYEPPCNFVSQRTTEKPHREPQREI